MCSASAPPQAACVFAAFETKLPDNDTIGRILKEDPLAFNYLAGIKSKGNWKGICKATLKAIESLMFLESALKKDGFRDPVAGVPAAPSPVPIGAGEGAASAKTSSLQIVPYVLKQPAAAKRSSTPPQSPVDGGASAECNVVLLVWGVCEGAGRQPSGPASSKDLLFNICVADVGAVAPCHRKLGNRAHCHYVFCRQSGGDWGRRRRRRAFGPAPHVGRVCGNVRRLWGRALAVPTGRSPATAAASSDCA